MSRTGARDVVGEACARDADLPFWLRPRTLVVIIALLTLARLVSGGASWLSEDEAYYRLWGLHPAWGYYDHPPMIGWWIAAGQWLVGDSALGVRLVGILATALGSLALWRAAFVLKGRAAAGWAVLFFNATILIGIGSLIATPDAPSVLFWGLSLWALAEWLDRGNANWWLAVGLFAGLGLISKYSVLFLGVGIILWLVTLPRLRVAFLAWQLWAGGLLAVMVTVPVIWWNHAHHWASFAKQFGRAVPHHWTMRYVGEFIGAELGLLNPLIALFALAGIAVAFRRWRRECDAAFWLPLATSLPFFAYLLFHSLHARVQANWPAPLFPALVLMAAFVAAELDGRSGVTTRALRLVRAFAVPVGVAFALVFYVHAAFPLTGVFARKDPTFQLRGWASIGQSIRDLAKQRGAEWVATTAYGMTGHLAYALKVEGARLPVVQLDERIRYAMAPPPPPSLLLKPALYVSLRRRDKSSALGASFAHVERIATLKRQVRGTILDMRGTVLEEIHVYLVDGSRDKLLHAVPHGAH